MEFDAAFNLLATESKHRFEALQAQDVEPWDLVQEINSLTRASLVHGSYTTSTGEIGRQTDCTGATMILNALLKAAGYRTGYAIVQSFPWQRADNARETHMVSTVMFDTTPEMHFADPVALPAYMFGTSGTLQQGTDKKVYIEDHALRSRTTLLLLDEAQLRAMHTIKVARSAMSGELKDQRRELEASYLLVQGIGSYAMRNLLLLDEANGDTDFSRFNDNIIPEAVRKSQLKYVRDKELAASIQASHAQEELSQRNLLPLAELAVQKSTDQYEANYWVAVRRTLELGFGGIISDPATKISWTDFASQGSDAPIQAYEHTMLTSHLGSCKSSLYAPSNYR